MSTLNVGTVNASSVVTTGDVNADSNTLFVDSSANRVGVGTSNPSATFEVVQDGGIKLKSTPIMETAQIINGAANSSSNIDLMDGSVKVWTSVSSGNWAHNLRGNSSTALATLMGTGEVTVYTMITALGASSGFSATLSIDGTAQTVYWAGAAPTARGGTAGYDVYTYTIIKTATSFIVLGSVTTHS
tara:strand:+ start:74 stop:634 length:561 start_codon:yes stop_codon:yes gene_type:complete